MDHHYTAALVTAPITAAKSTTVVLRDELAEYAAWKLANHLDYLTVPQRKLFRIKGEFLMTGSPLIPIAILIVVIGIGLLAWTLKQNLEFTIFIFAVAFFLGVLSVWLTQRWRNK